MKKLAILFILALSIGLVGCGGKQPLVGEKGNVINPFSLDNRLNSSNVVVVEGCEYFVIGAYASLTYVHKGNCKNPIHPENR